jgi:predicted phosphodiesterase
MTTQRWIAVSDTHGDQLDREAWAFVLDFIADFRPTIRVHLGDAWDFRWLRQGASNEERADDVLADIDAGMNLIDEYKPTAFLMGNHDHRLIRGCKDTTGVVRQAHRDLHDQIMRLFGMHGTQVYPYHSFKGVHMLGDLACIHGYHHGVYAPRQHAMAYGNCIHGHTHAVESAAFHNMRAGGAVTGRAIGCLCDLDMDYATIRATSMRCQHGFAYGEIRNGRAIVCQAVRDRVSGDWMLPHFDLSRRSSSGSTKPRSTKGKTAGSASRRSRKSSG